LPDQASEFQAFFLRRLSGIDHLAPPPLCYHDGSPRNFLLST
jgi:hypothetical protein